MVNDSKVSLVSMLKRKIKESSKEILRHLAFQFGYASFLDESRRKKGQKINHFKIENIDKRFENIYATKVWVQNEGQEASSGVGSEISATNNIRRVLPNILVELQAESLIDIGCGDWTWMKELRLPCRYLGVDIVQEVIDFNSKYKRDEVDFKVVNAINEPLPKIDVALCREVLFHLSFEDGLKMLSNIKNSCQYLIATNNDLWFNSNIRTGDFRNINLCRSPYLLPEPMDIVLDDTISEGRTIGVWQTNCIPDY